VANGLASVRPPRGDLRERIMSRKKKGKRRRKLQSVLSKRMVAYTVAAGAVGSAGSSDHSAAQASIVHLPANTVIQDFDTAPDVFDSFTLDLDGDGTENLVLRHNRRMFSSTSVDPISLGSYSQYRVDGNNAFFAMPIVLSDDVVRDQDANFNNNAAQQGPGQLVNDGPWWQCSLLLQRKRGRSPGREWGVFQ
jgi:hypothetical protein